MHGHEDAETTDSLCGERSPVPEAELGSLIPLPRLSSENSRE
ncbi:hypothetical protein SAMN05216266_108151 [Amycolatopsis marina]|uniref:Uncharacterized protein n=1 Tax=Amycolatopsis marina TaxID=490629 RepID=A0A1I1A7A5_9PSEU|nr:hypothetical protein [Amycolatopsis marina]SFB32448.1 hypothetical protein SAMN05216266_108151 [Amycolatopsis marina]